jgi:hypothetical protein
MKSARRQTQPTNASLASSRESTPEHGRITPSAGGGKDEDDWSYEGKSMTLRDILVRAGDATFAHFDILRERYLSHSLAFGPAQAAQALKEVHIFQREPFTHPDCIVWQAVLPRQVGKAVKRVGREYLQPSAPRVPHTRAPRVSFFVLLLSPD